MDTPVSASHPRRVTFDMLSVWALTLAGAAGVLMFAPSANMPFLFTKVSLIALGCLVGLAFFILARLMRGNIIVPPIALVASFWLVPAAYALSTLFSGSGARMAFLGTELETDTFGFMLVLAAFATMAALAFRRSNQYRVFFKVSTIVLTLVLAAQAIFILLGLVAPARFSASANIVGTFSDLGMFVGLGVVLLLLALRFLAFSRRISIFFWVLIAAGLVVVALVNSVLVWVLVGLTALGLFIEAIMRRRNDVRDDDFDADELAIETESSSRETDAKGLATPFIVLAVSLIFLIGGSTLGSALTSAFGVSYLDVRPSWQSTFDVGSHAYAAAPLFGTGPGTFGTEWLKFRDRSLNDTVFWNLDFTSGIGLIPTSFITTGVAGALAWIAFLILFLYIGIRALLFRAPEEPFARFTSIAAFVGACYVLTLALFAVPGPAVLLSGFFLAGIFVSSLRYGGSRREWGIVFSRNPRVGFVIVFALTLLLLAAVLASYVVIERYLASVDYLKATHALAAGDLDGTEAATQRSILFSPSDRAYQLLAADSIARMNQVANNTKLSPSEAQQQFQSALSGGIAAATAATQLNSNNYQNWVSLGSVYQTVVPLKISGAYENSKDAYSKAVALSPTDPTLEYSLAQLEIAHGDLNAAVTDLTNAISLKRDYTQAILLLSQIQVQQGKAQEALQAAEAAAYFAPNDQNVLFQVGILRSGTGDYDGAIQALSHAVDVNPQYANARFFLAVAYAAKGQLAQAEAQLEAIASLSTENAQAVATDIASLKAGKNPFPSSKIGAGTATLPQTPISDTSGTAATSAH